MRIVGVTSLLLLASCGGQPVMGGDGADAPPIVGVDAAVPTPDAAPPRPDAAPAVDAAPPAPRGQAVAIDSLAISGEGPTFRAFGFFLNGGIRNTIDDGQLRLVIEAHDLDDPSGQDDADLTLALYTADDPDGDATDNFDAADPDSWYAAAGTIAPGGRSLVALAGAVTGGLVDVSLAGTIDLTNLPLPFVDARLTGRLVAAEGGASIDYLADGILSGSVPVQTAGFVPVPASLPCDAATSLDVLVLGCTFLVPGSQPDTDRDADGLETFFDTDGNGHIDRCVDGNGAEATGETCWMEAAFADAWMLELSLHGTKILFHEPL